MKRRLYLFQILILLCVLFVACGQRVVEDRPIPTTTPLIPSPTLLIATPSQQQIPIATPNASPTTIPVSQTDSSRIIVGSGDFTEQFVLAHITMQLLQHDGFEVIDQTGLGNTSLAHEGLRKGEVDIYWEYTGTALSEFHNVPAASLPSDPQAGWSAVSALDQKHHDIIWLSPSLFNDTYTLMIRQGTIQDGLTTIDDLARFMNENDAPLTLCVEDNFYSVGDGLFPLMERYQFQFREENIFLVGYDQLYEELRAGNCDVAEGFSTDGRISAWNFQILADSRGFFPAYNAAPLVRGALLDAHPQIAQRLDNIGRYLDTPTMTRLNALVDLGLDGERATGDEMTPDQVARQFIEEADLLQTKPLLQMGVLEGELDMMMGTLSEAFLPNQGFHLILHPYSTSEQMRQALLEAEIDLAWENPSRALTQFHTIPTSSVPTTPLAAYQMLDALDQEHYKLSWLPPAQWQSHLAIFIDPTQDESLFSDVATFLEQLAANPDVKVCADEWTAVYAVATALDGEIPTAQLATTPTDEVLSQLIENQCQFAVAQSLDPQAVALGLQPLPDLQSRFPVFSLSPVLRQDLLAQYPELRSLFAQLNGALDTPTFSLLKAQVELGLDGVRQTGDEETAEQVARRWLTKIGLNGNRPTIAVGSRDFTEQFLLAHLSIALLQEAGWNVIDRTGLGGTNTGYDALKNGEIDLLWEYTGTALANFHQVDPLPTDPDEALLLARSLDEPNNLNWLASGLFNDTYTLMINPALLPIADQLVTIDDLATYMNANQSPLSLCVENDFYSRDDGLYPLLAHYDFLFDESKIKLVAYDQLYDSLRQGECDVAEGFSTDGRIGAWGFRNLLDSRQFFPAYNAAPIVRATFLEEDPALAQLMAQLAERLDDETMTRLNAQVDLGPDLERATGDEESAESVSRLYLCEQRLITQNCPQSAEAITTTEENTTLSPQGGTCTSLLVNGGFEEANGWIIPATASTASFTTAQSHTGDWSAQLGPVGRDTRASYSVINQRLTLAKESNFASISFWYYPISLDDLGGDSLTLYIYDPTLTIVRAQYPLSRNNQKSWSQLAFDLSSFAGESVILHFVVINDGDNVPTTMFLDDVVVQSCTDSK